MLEARRLMSAAAAVSLTDGVLLVRAGDDAPLNVNITYVKRSDAVRVRADGQPARTFGRAMVSAVRIVGGAGDDHMTVSDALTVPADVRAGGGNDRVRGGGGDDTIDAGAGDDAVRGGGGRDTILGGDGDDRIDPGRGHDRLRPDRRDEDRFFDSAAGPAPGSNPGPVGGTVGAGVLWSDVLAASADPTDAIQRAIDAAAAGGAGEVRLPPGQFRITRTLRVPQASGLKITGSGQIPDVRVTGHFGPATVLIWDGPAGGTMLEGRGTTFLTISDMTLIGRPARDAANRAGVLLFAAPLPGWGTGNWTVRNISFVDADVGVQMGEDRGDLNGADSVFDRVTFTNLDTGFRARNDQAVGFLFNYLVADGVKRVIYMERGGDVLVNGAQFIGTGGPGPDDYAIDFGPGGDNAAVSTFNQLRFEGGLRVRVGPYRRVEFRGLHEAELLNGGATFDVTASTVLLSGATLLRTLAPGWVRLRGDGTSQAAFSVDGAMFQNVADPGRLIDAAPGCYWSIRNSFGGWGSPIPDGQSAKWL